MHELSRQLSRPSKLAALICAVQEMCKEIYKNLSADSDFLLQLFQRFGVQFTAELFLMLQAHFCPSLRHSHQLVRLSRSIFKETHSWKSTMSQTIQCQWPESYHVCNVLCYTMRKLPGLKSNKYIGIAQKDCAQVLKSVHLSARRLDEKELLPCCWPSSSWLNDSAFRFQPVCKATSLCPSFCFQSVFKMLPSSANLLRCNYLLSSGRWCCLSAFRILSPFRAGLLVWDARIIIPERKTVLNGVAGFVGYLCLLASICLLQGLCATGIKSLETQKGNAETTQRLGWVEK